MSILNFNNQKTVDLAQERADLLQRHISSTWKNVIRYHKSGMKLLWEDLPDGVTPQDVLDKLGNFSAEVFHLSSLLSGIIEQVDPTKVKRTPEGITFTINEDGTVTLEGEIQPNITTSESEVADPPTVTPQTLNDLTVSENPE